MSMQASPILVTRATANLDPVSFKLCDAKDSDSAISAQDRTRKRACQGHPSCVFLAVGMKSSACYPEVHGLGLRADFSRWDRHAVDRFGSSVAIRNLPRRASMDKLCR
jgi:hypothetical protein